MTSPARQLPHQAATGESAVLILRAGHPYFRGLCETYHELKSALRELRHRSDPASLARARQLERARHLLLQAIVET